MAAAAALQPGYGNGGLESMEQFDKLSEKMTNSLKNLEFTRDMLQQLAESEKKSAQIIATILNKKSKQLRFSVVDQAVQSYWKKQEENRRHCSSALHTQLVEKLDKFISEARDRKKKLAKENGKVQSGFIQCKKETEKQKQRGETEWQKLEEQIKKNDVHKRANKTGKVKDLRNLQEKCAKAFKRYEDCIVKLNSLEKENHKQACELGKLLHESQKHAADRLALHYKMASSNKEFCESFIKTNKSIVMSKAPPVEDVLWRWLSFPKNHHTHALPCSSQEVSSKQAIGQSFKSKRRVEPDYQESPYLKPPKIANPSSSPSQNSQKQKSTKSSAASSSGGASPRSSSNHKKRDKKTGSKKPKKPKHKTPTQQSQAQAQAKAQSQSQSQSHPESQSQIQSHPHPQPQSKPVSAAHPSQPSVSENWANFGGDDAPGATATVSNDMFSAGNAMSDEDFFGAASNEDVFGSSGSIKNESGPNGAEQKQNGEAFGFGDDGGFDFDDGGDDVFGASPSNTEPTEQKDAPNSQTQPVATQTQDDMAFDDNFAVNFGDDEPPATFVEADKGAATVTVTATANGGGFDSTNWNTSFGDDDAFANEVEDAPRPNGAIEEEDELFATADAGDIWGTPGGDIQPTSQGQKEEKQSGDALFDDNFGDDFGSGNVVFAADDKANTDKMIITPDPPNMDDPMFGDDPEFPAFDTNISEMNGASDVDAGGDGLFDDDFDDEDDAAVEFPEFDVAAAPKQQKTDAIGSQQSPPPNEITSIPEPVMQFEASPLPNTDAVATDAAFDNPADDDADNPFGVDPFGASGSSADDHIDDDDDIDADNPFAMFEEPDQDGGDAQNENEDGGADDEFDPFS